MNIRSLIGRMLDKLFRRKKLSKQLLSDLQWFTPDYCRNIVDKYGNENWTLTAEQFQNTCNEAQLEYLDKLQSNGNKNKNIKK